MMRRRGWLAAAVAAASLGACSAGGGGDARDHFRDGGTVSGQDMAGGPGDLAMAPAYPAGPYGNQVGQTLADFSMAGYRLTPQQTDSTQLPWDTSISIADFYAKAQSGACSCMLISVGATWCGACQDEQPSVISDVQSDPTFCVLGILQDGQNPGVNATQQDVTDWTQTFHQNFTVAQGSSRTEALFNGWDSGGSIGLPFNLILQPKTMKVLDGIQGFGPDIYSVAKGECGANP
jgi:hypothetical protein